MNKRWQSFSELPANLIISLRLLFPTQKPPVLFQKDPWDCFVTSASVLSVTSSVLTSSASSSSSKCIALYLFPKQSNQICNTFFFFSFANIVTSLIHNFSRWIEFRIWKCFHSPKKNMEFLIIMCSLWYLCNRSFLVFVRRREYKPSTKNHRKTSSTSTDQSLPQWLSETFLLTAIPSVSSFVSGLVHYRNVSFFVH